MGVTDAALSQSAPRSVLPPSNGLLAGLAFFTDGSFCAEQRKVGEKKALGESWIISWRVEMCCV